MHLGWGEGLVIVAIILLIVGAKRLPELGRSLGESVREFQRAVRGRKK
jgi:sec-independent protein translocase protein TatA